MNALNAEMSVAPEIALLAAASFPVAGAAGNEAAPQPLTLGTLARHLRMLSATPERWWGLVRFDPTRSVQIVVEDQPGYGAWLMVMPPGDAGRDCDCDVATLIAGETTEGGAVLRPGSARVHGPRHWLRGHGTGYSISLHAQATSGRAPGAGFSVAEFAGRRELAIQRPVMFG